MRLREWLQTILGTDRRRSASALGVKVILALRDAPISALSVHLDTFAPGPGHEPSGPVRRSARWRAGWEDVLPKETGGVGAKAKLLPLLRKNRFGEREALQTEKPMTQTTTTTLPDLGTFEGFNFRDQSAIERVLTAEDVINWDHDGEGEAEFWPSGEDPLVKGIFSGNVTGSELTTLAELLEQLDEDRTQSLLRIQFALNVLGNSLEDLTVRTLEDVQPMIFYGTTVSDARKEAAFELFETYWPDLYKAWNEDSVGILDFDWYAFIDSPIWATYETRVGEQAVLMVAPN